MILTGLKKKRRYRRTVIIVEIVIGEFCCIGKITLQRVFVCPKAKPYTLTLKLKLNPKAELKYCLKRYTRNASFKSVMSYKRFNLETSIAETASPKCTIPQQEQSVRTTE